jgi:hypothetical protein
MACVVVEEAELPNKDYLAVWSSDMKYMPDRLNIRLSHLTIVTAELENLDLRKFAVGYGFNRHSQIEVPKFPLNWPSTAVLEPIKMPTFEPDIPGLFQKSRRRYIISLPLTLALLASEFAD